MYGSRMYRWSVAVILVPAALLLAAFGIFWQTQGSDGNQAWVPIIVVAMIFVIMAMYASQMVTRVGRAILITIALLVDGLLGYALWYMMTPHAIA